MSNSLKCPPAFEFLKAQCNIPKAQEIYTSMTAEERQKTDYISGLLFSKMLEIHRAPNHKISSTKNAEITLQNYSVTEKTVEFFQNFGYTVNYLDPYGCVSEEFPLFMLFVRRG